MASQAVEEVARYIPLIGSLIAAPLSFGGTCYMLKYLLDRMEKIAVEVVTFAAEHAGNHDDEKEDDD